MENEKIMCPYCGQNTILSEEATKLWVALKEKVKRAQKNPEPSVITMWLVEDTCNHCGNEFSLDFHKGPERKDLDIKEYP